ncbi:ATP-binding protein [Kitasatospora sp. RG8]|uniref:ATP-binding protein n=1 Tax=Kitasatospora sp. RG8 TaxID=2820815 RepID=UPI001AE035C5|nr:ATP-binding protein [Kitasatospora sp. RG8]MBP0449142.1 ATP-binding protein [Kitasatospora sp. RG8]
MKRPWEGPLPESDRTRRLRLEGAEGAVQRCRDFSRQALAAWHWLPGEDAAQQDEEEQEDDEQRAVSQDVLLMVSELVTNACLHAPGGPRELRLSWNGERLRVEVTDASPVPPQLRPHADPGRPGGHGLRVVDRLARAWGSLPEGTGKRVWLEVPSPLDHRVARIDHRVRRH